MKYTIVGCITNYGIEDIKPFVESIEQSGYAGGKEMMVYGISPETIDYLKSKGWDLYAGNLQEHIILQRFRDLYKLWEGRKDEIIIWVDVKDIIFQRNPQEWLDEYFSFTNEPILALSENMKMKDDPWVHTNSGTTFPLEWEWTQHNTSYCAGTIVGRVEYMRDLFIEIYHWSKATDNPSQLSDQAAYNVLIHLEHFKDLVDKGLQNDGFAVQMGTSYNPKFQSVLDQRAPIVTDDGIVLNVETNEPFYLVHQYDRYEPLKQQVHERYR